MSLDRLRYELKLLWKKVVLIPLTIMVVIGLFALLEHFLQQNPAHTFLAEVEMFLPLAAGIVAGTIIAQDSALELHLTMPRAYHRTGMLRLFMLFGWIACLAVLTLSGIALFKMLYTPTFTQSWSPLVQLLTLQLLWLAPSLWFMAVGVCLALLTQSRTASGTLVGGIWLLNILFVSTVATTTWLRPTLLFPATLLLYPATHVSQTDFATYWLTTRFELLGMALMLMPLAWLLLRNTERLLKGATEE